MFVKRKRKPHEHKNDYTMKEFVSYLKNVAKSDFINNFPFDNYLSY